MKASIIFEETITLLRNRQRRIVHQGGQSSGKTVNILAAIMVYCSEVPMTVATVTSMSFPHLKAGALRDFEKYCYDEFRGCIRSYHKTNHVFSLWNGSVIEFKTYEDEFSARGAKRQILFINEANTFDYMTYYQLDSRSELTILDYNPTIRFWCHDKVIGEPGTAFRISDHRHNPFLTKEKHEEIEKQKDFELWKVYARGVTGNVKGLIYTGWQMVESFPDIDYFFSIDYGYTNDPTALVRIGRDGNNIFVDEIAYTTGNFPPRMIANTLKLNGFKDSSILYSEHDPDMVKQLMMLGIRAVNARKGDGSLKAGIEKVKEYNVYYTAKSRNIKRELGLYSWQVDQLGNPTNVPIDANNHALDAIRYGVYSHFYRGKRSTEKVA